MRNDRKIHIVLYPDSTSYDCNTVILKATEYFDTWAYILHDKDVDEAGAPKKAHYHFLGKRSTMMTPKGICYQLGIQETSLCNIDNWKASVRYLVHADTPDKHPYDPCFVTANFDYQKLLQGHEEDDGQAKRIFQYIIEHPQCDTRQVTQWVLDNGLWSGFRRGYAVWDRIIGGIYESRRYSQSRH